MQVEHRSRLGTASPHALFVFTLSRKSKVHQHGKLSEGVPGQKAPGAVSHIAIEAHAHCPQLSGRSCHQLATASRDVEGVPSSIANDNHDRYHYKLAIMKLSTGMVMAATGM